LRVEAAQNGVTHTSRLTISPLHYTDTGRFTCAADNSTDSNNASSIYIYVYGKTFDFSIHFLQHLHIRRPYCSSSFRYDSDK